MARQPLNAYLTRVLPGGALTMNPGGQLYIYEEGTTDEAKVWDAKVGGDLHSQPLVGRRRRLVPRPLARGRPRL